MLKFGNWLLSENIMAVHPKYDIDGELELFEIYMQGPHQVFIRFYVGTGGFTDIAEYYVRNGGTIHWNSAPKEE